MMENTSLLSYKGCEKAVILSLRRPIRLDELIHPISAYDPPRFPARSSLSQMPVRLRAQDGAAFPARHGKAEAARLR
jgi:hypothetical protein